ncbi:MAG TPA: winged helix-turn-helix domain-containing protein [Candidatus Binatia bacterium]|jgi:DNA-binding transcriptional ArsR family regulator|nr:winged helix-turn-helix domain-containing protein [Candidatus Binatia bacterium]
MSASLTTPELFVRAGLRRADGAAYDALAAKDGASIADICRSSGLHRPSVYRALARLEKAGLVRTSRRGRRVVYLTTDPERLARLLGKADEDNAAAASRFIAAPAGAGVTVLRGRHGLAKVLEDMVVTLRRDDVFYRTTSRRTSTTVEGFVPKGYRAKRDALKIQQFVITNAALRATTYKKRTDCLSKALPKDGGDPFEYDIALIVYGDKVATIDYAGETAVIVKNARLARFHARLFRALFDRL